jgi:para-aminobenzoate synthetase component 1
VIPHIEELVPATDPVQACERLAGWPHRLFLDSAARDGHLGRYSYVTADPVALIRSGNGRTEYRGYDGRIRPALDPLRSIRELLAPFAAAPVNGLPPFQGGAVGFLAYDWGRKLESVAAPAHDDVPVPDALFGVYDWVLAWDHQTSRSWLISTGMPELSPAARSDLAVRRAAAVRTCLQGVDVLTDRADRGARPHDAVRWYPVVNAWPGDLEVRSTFTRAGYVSAAQRVREHILAGDIFQANLSQRFEAPLVETAWGVYCRLRLVNPAPFAAFLDFGEAVVLSASPERFLRLDGSGCVEARPIKGTRPRAATADEDAALARALATSEKDRAENLMIVDLMRNDLSKVCRAGSVRVRELCAVESFATVHHLVSTVVGRLEPGRDALDLLQAAFPGGSITGAPKIRAMQVISELEPTSRGIYCGSIGYWSLSGDCDASIAIRTALVRDGRIYFGAGGGVVADSDPEQEYLETLHKARGIINALARAPL